MDSRTMMRIHKSRGAVISLTWLLLGFVSIDAEDRANTVAISGVTVIDGNGGLPVADATVLVVGKTISAVGAREAVRIPAAAKTIDGTGKYLTPGFIDTNVHLTLYGGDPSDRYETLVRYVDRNADVALEAAQLHLKHGVTTVRDSYGALLPLVEVRNAIARGEAVGPRILAAGNIVGWGGPFSVTWGMTREEGLSLFQEQMNDYFTQGSGEELIVMSLGDLRTAIKEYLDKGPDFIKYGGTSHWSNPALIGFSPDAQRVIVEETHKRGLVAEAHSTTPEALRTSILAGINLVQHPESLSGREIGDDLVALIRDRGVICSISTNMVTGEAWEEDRREVDRKRAEARKESGVEKERAKTSAELRREQREFGLARDIRRRNVQKLIQAGCIVTVGTDNYVGAAPELARTSRRDTHQPGAGTLLAIEGLVELGMTSLQAISAATKNGALACDRLQEYGTVEPGKLADLLMFAADPLTDISNIRTLVLVMKEGLIFEPAELPAKPIFYRRPSNH